jgi:hypothetical protein
MNTPGRTRKAVEIQFHSDNATGTDAHPAINVKYRGSYNPATYDNLTDGQREGVWNNCVESFWEQAGTIAHEHGYSGVFSEGRSGGWLVPYYQYADGKLSLKYVGQGPALGYPSYPDVEDRTERQRFVRFRKDITRLLASVPDMLKSEADFIREVVSEA